MTQPGLIDRHGLLIWADSIAAGSELPRLLRRLILETGRGVVHLGFPAGEGVAAGSWDGTVRATEQAPYVPQGLSLWEASVNKNANTKANADYEKRKTTPAGSPTQECTYVEVVLRAWTNREKWARDRSAEGRWKAVRALGVDDVDAWLESAPITHAWLSELIGMHPHGLVTAETWWRAWSAATTPGFPTALMAAGRDKEMRTLQEALARPGELITIRGSSRDEVAAFVASLALTERASDGGTLLARTAFVGNVETWRRLRGHRTSLVLVALTEEVAAEFAPDSPHVLIAPLTGSSNADIVLPQLDSQVAAEVLKRVGLPERQADEVGKLARLNLLAARRRLANKRELHQPNWAWTPASKTVRRTALIGRWNENSDADRTLMEKTVGITYDTLREQIATLAAGGDPLLARVSSTVGVVSPIDAWLLLRGELRRDDFDAFHDAARTVFLELDPRFDLSREERWRASLLGKTRLYSNDIRQGLATTLALLGAYGRRPVEGANITSREWAAWIIRDLLAAANADTTCHLWASLADVLPLLAEAAPSEFLDAVAVGTGGHAPLLRGIFEDTIANANPLVQDSTHSSLLWALETCAWSPDHFGRAVDMLARLAEIDPGGRLANRPFASFQAIFLPWLPQTSVPADRRLGAIDGLRDRHAGVAWKLLISLLPDMHSMAMNIREPQFRDWKPEQVPVTMQEYLTDIDEIWKRALSDAALDLERWVALIKKIDNLPPPERAATLARLDELSSDGRLAAEQRAVIWEALRAKAARHREFASAPWALPADEVGAIETTAARFEPTSPTERHRWLFKQESPPLPNIKRSNDYAAYDTALAKARAAAATEIADTSDWSGLRCFASSTEFSAIVGVAVAQARRYEHEKELMELLGPADTRAADFAAGYFSERFRTDGWSWLEPYLAGGELSPDQVARLLLYTRDYPKAWETAEAMGEPVARIFWQRFPTWGLGGDFAQVDFVAERLLGAYRPNAALDFITLFTSREDDMSPSRVELVVRGLEALLRRNIDDAEARLLGHYGLVELLSALEHSKLPREQVARLEWAFLPALGFDSQPAALTEMLSRDPDYFVDIIRRTFRLHDDVEEAEAATEPEAEANALDANQQPAIAANAYRLLTEWKDVTGKREDGTLDEEALEAWVTDVRAKLLESGHLGVGDTFIGHVLAWAPSDADGSRPGLAVRKLLERLDNSDVDDGLRVELRNSRGVTTRGMLDGGDQERAVAARYFEQAEKFADRWPRTAALLRKLGEDYEQEARPIDDQAERRRTGFDS